jgi:integrase
VDVGDDWFANRGGACPFWYDLDFDYEVIEIKDRIYEGVRDSAKTRNSVRTIPLQPVAKRLLLGRRPAKWKAFDLVFATSNGTAIERRNLARQLHSTCDRLKIERVNWHWFRHITASYLDSLGVPTSVVKELLGHYSESVTSRIYTHAAMDKIRAAVEQMEKALNCPQTDSAALGA